MNYDKLESGVPSPYTENTITCIACGKPFAFSQTVEGRCMRDHIAYADNERRQLLATVAARGSGGANPSNIVVQGPTINMMNQQSTNVSAIAQSNAIYGRPRVGCFRRWRKRFYCLLCLLLLGGAAYGIVMAALHAGAGGGGRGGGGGMTSSTSGGVFSSTSQTAVLTSVRVISPASTATTTHSGFFPWRTTTAAATTTMKKHDE